MALATIGEQISEEVKTALVGQKSVDDALKQTIQARAQEAATAFPAVWWFHQASEWDVAPWWSQQRDLDLRAFVKREGNDILAGAVASMVSKFKAMSWVVEGPKATVSWAQDLLAEAEFGKGWGTLIGKVIEDYYTTDKGAFIEITGPGKIDKALEGLPTGLAHMDSAKCTPTGDAEYPVIFHSGKDGLAHKIHVSRVIHLVDMESPNEDMKGIGWCSVSRTIASSQILLMVAKYKKEKLDDLPQAGLLLFNNVVPQRWDDARADYERERRKLGQEVWANVMTLFGIDPAQPADAKFINFSQIPDHFDEQQTITNYVNIVALAMKVDVREIWPASQGPLGSGKESEIQAQKARGKGVGELISAIERAINWKVLPSRVNFHFDNIDSEEDLQRAQLEDAKVTTIMKMFAPDPNGEMVATRDEVRQMLADNCDYFPEDFLLVDTTEDETASDTEQQEEQKDWSPHVVMDREGKIVRRLEKGYRVGIKGSSESGNYGHAGRPGQVGGSAPAGQYIYIGKEQRRQSRVGIQTVLEHGLKTGNEAVYMIGRDGTKVNGTQYGEKDYVNVEPDLLQKSSVLVHNHPSSGTFSSDDIQTMIVQGIDHLLVIGHDGTLYRASRTRNTKPVMDDVEVRWRWKEYMEKYRPEYNQRVSAGQDKSAATRECFHKAMIDLSSEFGFDYARVTP